MTNEEQVSIIEFSEDIAQQQAPVPLPARSYPAIVRTVEAKTSQKGNRYASVGFFVAPEAYPADYPTEEAPDGTTLYYQRLSLEDTAPSRYRLRKFCEAIGAPMSKRVDLNEWINLTATINVKHDTYQGETRAQIESVSKL